MWSCESHVILPAVVEVAFEALDYSVIEGEGKVIVCAVLMGHLDVPVSIFFSVRDQPEQDQGKETRHQNFTQTCMNRPNHTMLLRLFDIVLAPTSCSNRDDHI